MNEQELFSRVQALESLNRQLATDVIAKQETIDLLKGIIVEALK
jgi:hypothetical protein